MSRVAKKLYRRRHATREQYLLLFGTRRGGRGGMPVIRERTLLVSALTRGPAAPPSPSIHPSVHPSSFFLLECRVVQSAFNVESNRQITRDTDRLGFFGLQFPPSLSAVRCTYSHARPRSGRKKGEGRKGKEPPLPDDDDDDLYHT